MLSKTNDTDKNKPKKYKYMIASFLVAIIIVFGSMVYYYKDIIFTSNIEIEYADGCIEKYVNSKLVSPLCEEGRAMAETYHGINMNRYDYLIINQTIINYSII